MWDKTIKYFRILSFCGRVKIDYVIDNKERQKQHEKEKKLKKKISHFFFQIMSI